jgi:hypothetical protein
MLIMRFVSSRWGVALCAALWLTAKIVEARL